MMTGKVVTTYSSVTVPTNITSVQNGTLASNMSQYTAMEVATAVTFTVALIQVKFCITHAQYQQYLFFYKIKQ